MQFSAELRRLLKEPEDAIGVAVLVVIFVVMLAAVFFRYVLNDSLIWAEEIARFGLIAMTFIGAGTGFRKDAHIRIDLADQLPNSWRAPVRVLVALVSLALVSYLMLQAIRIMPVLANSRSAALEMPMALIYLVVAAGLAGATVRILLNLVSGSKAYPR